MEQGKETKLTFDERDKFGNVVISDVENLLKYSFVFFEVSYFFCGPIFEITEWHVFFGHGFFLRGEMTRVNLPNHTLKIFFLLFKFREFGQQVYPKLTFAPREGFLSNRKTPNEAFLTLDSVGVFTIDVFYDGQSLSEGVTILVITRKCPL